MTMFHNATPFDYAAASTIFFGRLRNTAYGADRDKKFLSFFVLRTSSLCYQCPLDKSLSAVRGITSK
jgi:hypothetical protein